MEISYEKIVEVNKGVAYTNVRGKNYAEVAQRVQAFRNLIPGGYITTDIIRMDEGIVYMKAECGYYENGQRVMLATGMAFERQDASNINKTSYIENCETSAIGRALGFMGLGSEKSIASAEEVSNAIATQEAIEAGKIPDPSRKVERKQAKPDNVTVTKGEKLPPKNPVKEYVANELGAMKQMFGVSDTKEMADRFNTMRLALVADGIIPDVKSDDQTMEQAQEMVEAIYKHFKPSGERA